MNTNEAMIFSVLKQDNIRQLESIFQRLLNQFDSISGRRAFLKNVGIDDFFINRRDFNLPLNQFINILIDDLKNYRVSRQNPYYHPLLLVIHHVTAQPKEFDYLGDLEIEFLKTLQEIGNIQIKKFIQNKSPQTIEQDNQKLDNYLNQVEKNIEKLGALDIQKNVDSENRQFEFERVIKITNFELPFGAFNMRGDAFFIIDYFQSINKPALRQYSTQCLEYGRSKTTLSVTSQIFNARIPCNICFAIAVVNNLDQETKTKIRQENPFDYNLDSLWYEVPIIYCLDESSIYFYDQPSSFWEQFKGEIAWKRLREIIKNTLIV